MSIKSPSSFGLFSRWLEIEQQHFIQERRQPNGDPSRVHQASSTPRCVNACMGVQIEGRDSVGWVGGEYVNGNQAAWVHEDRCRYISWPLVGESALISTRENHKGPIIGMAERKTSDPIAST